MCCSESTFSFLVNPRFSCASFQLASLVPPCFVLRSGWGAFRYGRRRGAFRWGVSFCPGVPFCWGAFRSGGVSFCPGCLSAGGRFALGAFRSVRGAFLLGGVSLWGRFVLSGVPFCWRAFRSGAVSFCPGVPFCWGAFRSGGVSFCPGCLSAGGRFAGAFCEGARLKSYIQLFLLHVSKSPDFRTWF